MNILLKTLRDELMKIVADIDDGNSNLSGDEIEEALQTLKHFTDKNEPLTKYEAAEYIHVSRATFDNLVKEGKLPKGEKLYQGDANIFWFEKDLIKYRNATSLSK